MVFFTNGGAEATENAVRMARLHTSRHKVLSHYRSYHGGTNGAISMTGDPRRWGSEPGMPGVVKFWGPYAYRSAFHSTSEAEECERALAHLDDVLMVEGGHTVAAIILETVVGTNGILVPPDGYLQGVRDRCDRHGIVMICDEVMAGFGRCGEWFAFQKWGVQPDLVCFAKGVNSGLPAARRRRHQPDDRRHVPRPAVPRRAHLLGSPVGVRVGRGQHQHLQGGRHHRARPNARAPTSSLPGWRSCRPTIRASAKFAASVCSGHSISSPIGRHARAARAVQRVGRRRQADGRPRRGVQAAWAVAVHPLQPAACRAAVHGHGRRGHRRPRHSRRGSDGRRLVLHGLTRPPVWRKPGRTGAILYAVLATLIGATTAFVSRLEIERQRGRREAARTLPAGPIIVISNHTSYADGVLLALACRRMGRSLRLLATSGVFSAPVLGTVARKLGFIKVKRGAADAATSLDEAAHALAEGEAVGIFPEGRLTRDPMMWPERAKTGSVRLGAAHRRTDRARGDGRCAPGRRPATTGADAGAEPGSPTEGQHAHR